MAERGEEGMDLNLNLSPPSTPHLGLALGLGVGPASPVSAASANEGEGSIPGRVWPRPFQVNMLSDPQGSHRGSGLRASFNTDDALHEPEAVGRYRSRQARHRWRGQFRRVRPSFFEATPIPSSESLSPFIILRAVDHANPTDTELEQRNGHAETLKENPGHLGGCSVTATQDADDNDNNASNFECNICLEMARDPVVTSCGHLFCWACLYQWLHVHSTSRECPVCKGEVSDPNITPIYGRGNSDHAGSESNMIENGEKIPPRPRANRIESLRQRRPISRRFMEAIRLTRRRETHNDNRAHGGARQDEPTTTAQGVDNFIGAAADQILNGFSLVHFHRQTSNLQRSRSGEDRWQMREVLARRSLLRPSTTTSPMDVDDREGERERIWGHLQLGRLHRSERPSSDRLSSMEGMVDSFANNSGNSDINSNVNDQGLQEVVRSGVSDNNRERASISSTNAMILPGSRTGDAVVEQDSGISSSIQRRRHVPSCSDSDGGLLNARKRRRLN